MLHEGSRNIDEQTQWILNRPTTEENFIRESYKNGPCGMYSLISINQDNQSAEQSRLLIPYNFSNEPYVVEAMKIILFFGFEFLELSLITGKVINRNTRMILMHEYFGNRILEETSEKTQIKDEFYPLVNIELTRERYFEVAKPRFAKYLKKF
jgi:RimJ/RimL family protein N-acetyltransferase